MSELAIQVPVSPGELIDKITILEIKRERITEPGKLANVLVELGVLNDLQAAHLPDSDELQQLADSLRRVNETLWEIEDSLRRCESSGDFGGSFVELARSVYRTNDRRCEIKRRINTLLGSGLMEEKSYPTYEKED